MDLQRSPNRFEVEDFDLYQGESTDFSSRRWSDGRMYAISFDLMVDALLNYYPGSNWRSAYGDVQRILERRGFWNQQGSVYFSHHKSPTEVWLAITELQERLDWFPKVVRDLKMLRIEENSDLMPLLKRAELPLQGNKPRHLKPGGDNSSLKFN